MAASRSEIEGWFDRGVTEGAAFMIVVCDTWDHDDYPVYAKDAAEAHEKHDHYNGKNMQRVMEVYDLGSPKDAQMREHRALHLPPRPTT